MMTAAVVAFVRKLFLKADGKPAIDGRLAVFALAATVAFLAVVWAQLRAGGGVDWTKLLIDWPVVFGLAAGGTSWLQKIRKDGLYTDLGTTVELVDDPSHGERAAWRLSFGGIEFPYTELGIQKPGDEAKAYSVTAHCKLDDLYPSRLRSLVSLCEQGTAQDLFVPTLGRTIKVKCTEWPRTSDDERVSFTFVEVVPCGNLQVIDEATALDASAPQCRPTPHNCRRSMDSA